MNRDEIEALEDVELDNLFALTEDVRDDRRRTRARERAEERANTRALAALLKVEAEFIAQGADPVKVRARLAEEIPGGKPENPGNPAQGGPDRTTDVTFPPRPPAPEPEPEPEPVPEDPPIAPEDSSVPPLNP